MTFVRLYDALCLLLSDLGHTSQASRALAIVDRYEFKPNNAYRIAGPAIEAASATRSQKIAVAAVPGIFAFVLFSVRRACGTGSGLPRHMVGEVYPYVASGV